MSGTTCLDGDTFDRSHDFLRQGGSLDDLAGLLHIDAELLGRLLGLPVSPPVQHDPDHPFDLWAADRLDAVL